MRIQTLQLLRYGHFTDFTLNFGDKDQLTSDLHLVYGENEAGKSTTLSAIVDLLFGMLKQSRYNFVHNYKTMEIGATLEQNSQTLELRRFKNQLTGGDNQPLAQSYIDTHGLSRDDFQSRFSFDESTLKEGGEAILDNNGELGTALFSATSGIADFNTALENLLQPANTFYEPGRQKNKTLFDIKQQLSDIESQRASIDVNASHWNKLEQVAAEKQVSYEEFKDKTDNNAKALADLQRQYQALNIAKRYEKLKATARTYKNLPTIPPSWQTDANALIKQQVKIKARLEQLHGLNSTLQTQKSQLVINDELITHAPSIDRLHSERTLFEQRATDLSNLTQKSDSLRERILSRQAAIQMPSTVDDKSSELTEAKIELLRSHLALHDKLSTELEIATVEKHKLNEKENEINQAELEEPVSTVALSNFLEIVTENAYLVKQQQTQDSISEIDTELAASIAKLNPWRGDSEQLTAIPTPSRTHLASLENQLQSVENALELTRETLNALNLEREDSTLKLKQHSPDRLEHSIRDARLSRDTLWQKHIDSIDQEAAHTIIQKTAREYILAQSELDSIIDSELSNAEKEAGLNSLKERLESIEIKVQSHQEKELSHIKLRDKLTKEVNEIASSLGLDKSSSPKEIIDWLDMRTNTIDVIQRRNKLLDEHEKHSTASSADAERLKELTISVDTKTTSSFTTMTDPTEIIALAQATVQNQEKKNNDLLAQKEAQVVLEKQLRARQSELDAAQEKHTNWSTQWEQLLEDTWITDKNPRSVQTVLDNLHSVLEMQSNLSDIHQQLEILNKAQGTFSDTAENLLKTLERFDSTPLGHQLDKLFQDTQDNLEKYNGLKQLIEREAKLQEDTTNVESELAPITKQIQTMFSACSVSTIAELESTIENVKEHAVHQDKLDEYEQDLKDILQCESANEALDKLRDLDETLLHTQIQERSNDAEYDKHKLAELHHEFRKAQDELDSFKSDATVAQLTQTKTNLLTSLEDQALHTMRLRLGKLAIDQGIRRFREQHRSSMLENAKRAFTAITCGSYIDLTTQPGKRNNSEELVGIRNTGQSTLAVDMSTGTRAQLYLALRIAAYQDYCKTREPLPFVADDIMESFDEQRTQATLVLLNDMAKQGQIIYLTHHRHVLEIAQDTLKGKAKVHELPRRTLAVADA